MQQPHPLFSHAFAFRANGNDVNPCKRSMHSIVSLGMVAWCVGLAATAWSVVVVRMSFTLVWCGRLINPASMNMPLLRATFGMRAPCVNVLVHGHL